MVPGRPSAVGGRPRGGDLADGALAGWLLVSAAQAAGAVGGGGVLAAVAALATALVLAGAVVPFLRFHPLGWRLAAAGLAAHALQSALRADWSTGGRAAAALLPHLLALGYLAWVRGSWRGAPAEAASTATAGLTRRRGDAEEAVPETGGGGASDDAVALDAPAPDPHAALAAIHRRITAAGSACALSPADALAEAERHGVDAAALRREGLALYRTFLDHFAAAGTLSPRAERELACLAALLDLEPRAVDELHPPSPPVAGVPLEPGERALAARDVELHRLPAGAGGEEGLHLDPVRPARDLAGSVRVGVCRFVVTDRRLLLVAPSGERSPLPLARVAHAAAHENGVEVRPRRGPALFLRFHEGVAEAARAILHAASTPHDEGT